MTRILFERRTGAYLPEIDAYIRYLRMAHHDVQAFDSKALDSDAGRGDFDVIWRFMGIDRTRMPESVRVVHEYASLSVSPFAGLKNRIKRAASVHPSLRIFLNERVQADMGFSDSVPSFRRDMGVDDSFFDVPRRPDHDFVYSGSLYRGRAVLDTLELFAGNPRLGSVLVIGDVRPDDAARLGRGGNVTFTGRVPYGDVPALLGRGRYGLNLMPDVYPFNVQTSTKLLEYMAAGLPVVSTRYDWAVSFAKARGARFFWLPSDISSFGGGAALDGFDFVTPPIRDRAWDTIIRDSGIFTALLN